MGSPTEDGSRSTPGWPDYSEVDEEELAAWTRLVDAAADAIGVPVVSVALNRQPPAEIETMHRLATERLRSPWLTVDCADDPDAARAVFGFAAGAVVRSFHAAWFAIEGGTPVVFPTGGAYYSAKAEGLGALAGLDEAFHDSTLPADADGLRRRWNLVEATVTDRPLSGVAAVRDRVARTSADRSRREDPLTTEEPDMTFSDSHDLIGLPGQPAGVAWPTDEWPTADPPSGAVVDVAEADARGRKTASVRRSHRW